MDILIEINPNAALLTDPESEEAQIQNILLNMMGGLAYEDLSEDEIKLLNKHGYPNSSSKLDGGNNGWSNAITTLYAAIFR